MAKRKTKVQRDYEAVITNVLQTMERRSEAAARAGEGYYAAAETMGRETLGYHCNMVDGNREYESAHELQDAMRVLSQVTGVHV